MGRIWSPVNGVSTKFVANRITRFHDGFLPGALLYHTAFVNYFFLSCLSLPSQSPETVSQSSCANLSLETMTTGFMYERFAATYFHGMHFDGLSPLSATPHVVAQRGGRGKVPDLAVGSIRIIKYPQAPPPAQVCVWFERNAACLRCTVDLKTIRFHGFMVPIA